tara:strand:- start:2053 stop:2790 length:738 start_codon:yes stop_codon:yes gene_type:complete
MKRIKNWNSIHAGINPLDELHRALRDVQRLTEIFKRIADERVVHGYELPEELAEIKANTKADARACWLDWEPALERATTALNDEKAKCEGLSKGNITKALGALNSVFPPPIFLIPGRQEPGDHLGALMLNRDGTSSFPIEKVRGAFVAINDAVDVLMLVAPLWMVSDEKNTEKKRLDDMRPARWFSTKTNEGVYADLLRIAVRDNRLSGSIKPNNRWMHSVQSVCELYPEYKSMLELALDADSNQ